MGSMLNRQYDGLAYTPSFSASPVRYDASSGFTTVSLRANEWLMGLIHLPVLIQNDDTIIANEDNRRVRHLCRCGDLPLNACSLSVSIPPLE